MLHEPQPLPWLDRLPLRHRRRFAAQSLILDAAGSTSDGETPVAHLVVEGVVRLSLLADDGKEQVLAYLPPGSLFGEQAALGQRGLQVHLVAIADEDCEIGAIAADEFIDVIAEFPQALGDLMTITSHKTSLFLKALGRASFGSPGARIATILETLGATQPEIEISQDRLAHLTGLTRVTVAKHLSQMEAAGAIAMERKRIVILDPERLRAFAESDVDLRPR